MTWLNEASWERIVRVVLGIVMILAALTGLASGAAGILLAVAGAVLLLTATAGFCPIYAVLHTGTCRPARKA
jgi:hypothetical protein